MKTIKCPNDIDFPALLEYRGKVDVIRRVEAVRLANYLQSHYWAERRKARFRLSDGSVETYLVSVIRPKTPQEMSRALSGSMSTGVPTRKGTIRSKDIKRSRPSVRIKAPKKLGRSAYEKALISLCSGRGWAFRRILKEWKDSLPRNKRRTTVETRTDGKGAMLYFPR